VANLFSRLAGPANIANGTSTIFTGTAAHTYLIRSILIVNNTSAKVTVKIGIGGVTDALLVSPPLAIPTKGWVEWKPLLVLSGAETIQANATATGTTVTISGVDKT
jgi:hypothetical protein